MAFKLNVNGHTSTVDAPADMPLLWALRDILDLRGTKYGCGIGQCGACTVHLAGAPVRACITTLEMVKDRPITTLEGLSPDGTHPVQIAWEEIDVAQCGYCQAGQMMSAAALLAKTPKPTDKDIDTALNGNLCRCGTYLRIRAAVHKAADLASSGAPTKSAGPAAAALRNRE
jgi:isoquinoline 1-oxidoreductase subunit alpha